MKEVKVQIFPYSMRIASNEVAIRLTSGLARFYADGWRLVSMTEFGSTQVEHTYYTCVFERTKPKPRKKKKT